MKLDILDSDQTYALVTVYGGGYTRRGRFSFAPGEARELAAAMRFYADAIDPPAKPKDPA